jgi:adenylate cyclase
VPVGGASGIAVYLVDRIMFVGNVGNALAVLSRARHAMPVSKQYDLWDRDEAVRIRSAEGWISPAGLRIARSTCCARSGTTSPRR